MVLIMSQAVFPYLITAVISIASGMTLWGLERLVGRRRDRRAVRAQVVTLCARYEAAGRRAADGDVPQWRDDEAGALSAMVTSKEGRDALYGRDYGRLCTLANSVKDRIITLEQCVEDVSSAGSALVRDAHGARLLLGDHREVLDERPLHLAVSWRSHARKYASVASGAFAIAFTLWVLIGRATGATGALAFTVASIGAAFGAIWILRVKQWTPRSVRVKLVERRDATVENLAAVSFIAAFTTLSMSELHVRMDFRLAHASPAVHAVYALAWGIVVGLFGGVTLYWLVRQVRRIAELRAGIRQVDALQIDGVCRAAAELPDVQGLAGCGCTGLECLARRYRV
jgi:hypothetical protein